MEQVNLSSSDSVSTSKPDWAACAAIFLTLCCLAVAGCSVPEIDLESYADDSSAPTEEVRPTDTTKGASNMPMGGKMMNVDPQTIEFKDKVSSNVEPPQGLDGLVFLNTEGLRVKMSDYLGKKNVVLVFTEGFSGGMLCPFCKTQTSRLVANYDKFAELDTEVLVVYPGTRDHLEEFIEAARTTDKRQVDKVPFPLLLDEQFKAVDFFNIRSNLAHPSTYVIDKAGNVRLAYVGDDMTADRPSVDAILNKIRSAN